MRLGFFKKLKVEDLWMWIDFVYCERGGERIGGDGDLELEL